MTLLYQWLQQHPYWKQFALFVILFLATAQPYSQVVTNEHDTGSQAAYDYWLVNGFQWGKDIVQNVGPLGFINYPQRYTGFLVWEKLAIHLALTTLFVVLVIQIAKQLPTKRIARIFLIIIALFSTNAFSFDVGNIARTFVSMDIQLYILTLLISYRLFALPSIFWVILLGFTLAALSLAKGSLLFISLAIIVCSTLHTIIRKKYLHTILLPTIFSTTILGLWHLCGQSIANLPLFLQATLHFSQGYSDANALYEPIYLTIIGGGILIIASGIICFKHSKRWQHHTIQQHISHLSLAFIEGFILFVAWKHGFVRADLHTLIFFQTAICALPLWMWLQPVGITVAPTSSKKKLRLETTFCIYLILLCGFMIIPHKRSFRPLENLWILSNPIHYAASLADSLQHNVASPSFPVIQHIVGNHRLGHFGWNNLTPLIYHPFNYSPMPSTISFAGWNRWIMDKDAAFYHDETTAPEYVLFSIASLSDRLASQNDALAQLELLQHYDIIWHEKICPEKLDYLLLQRHNTSKPVLTFESLNTLKKIPLGEWVTPPTTDHITPLRMKVQFPTSRFGMLLSTFYKPSSYTIEYTLANGITEKKKIVPNMAKEGFLIAPFISTNNTWSAALHHDDYNFYREGKSTELSKITQFRIHCEHLPLTCAKDINISFEAIHGLTLGRIPAP